MSVFFYNIFLLLFKGGTRLAYPFNAKARKWVDGRRDIFNRLREAIAPNDRIIWMHCASLGEFEQGRPVLERIKGLYPQYKILLTFFSPSGYEVQKNYNGADWVFYLPVDGPRNAKEFLEIVHPSLVIFVKYEFWYYYLKKIKYRNIPLLLISALFRKDMSFFKWYGGLQRKMLSRFDHLFVQTAGSKNLIDNIGLGGITTVSGDTRFDRVAEIANAAAPIPFIEAFSNNNRLLIAGSTWPEDEDLLHKAFSFISDPSLRLIIAPHEIDARHISAIQELFPKTILYSEIKANPGILNDRPEANCLIIDNIGMLSRLYQYAYITYIGGGLRQAGVHNVLEAAVYSKPVLFGPFYKKYTEAIGLVESGGGLSFTDNNKDGEDAAKLINHLITDPHAYEWRSRGAGEFVKSNEGAAEKIIRFIQEKRLLTN